MGFTNFPNGVTSFGIPQLGSDGVVPIVNGNYYFVDSNGGGLNVGTWDAPFDTIAGAYTAATASNYDCIVMKQGHAETISAATGLLLTKLGVTIVGLGSGAERPTITLSGTAATCTINISAASQTLKNFIISSGVAELTSAITISAASVTLDALEYREANATYTILAFCTGTAGADYLTIKNCKLKGTTTSAGNASCLVGVAGMNDVVIADNLIMWIGANNAATCGIYNAGAGLRWHILRNFFHITGGGSVTVINATTCTGLAAYNSAGTATTTITDAYQFDAGYSIENYVTETVDTNGILDPIAT